MASKLLSVKGRPKKRNPKSATVVSAYEAKTHFSALLERASKGESIIITKHGQEVAKLSPSKTLLTKEEAIEKLKTFGKGRKLGKGLSVRDLIEEGRH